MNYDNGDNDDNGDNYDNGDNGDNGDLIIETLSGPRNYGKSIEWKLEGDPWVSKFR